MLRPTNINQACPHCGYCPHCGRSNQAAPYYLWPYYPFQVIPFQTTGGGLTWQVGNANQNHSFVDSTGILAFNNQGPKDGTARES